jgi:hypothetical protein
VPLTQRAAYPVAMDLHHLNNLPAANALIAPQNREQIL